MASVGQKDTGAEMTVRRLLHQMEYRYSLHRRGLPGKPDLVFRSRRKIIFVHGCFWHGHACRFGRLPKSNVTYWKQKIQRNRDRDAKNIRDLNELGWDVRVVWECETKDLTSLKTRLSDFISDDVE